MTLQESGVLTGIVFGGVGMATGLASLLISVLVVLRDRPVIKIRMHWGYKVIGQGGYDPEKTYGLIVVENIGRRPITVSHACLELPEKIKKEKLVIKEGLAPRSLSETNPSTQYLITEESMQGDAVLVANWRRIRAVVSGPGGKRFRSKRLGTTERRPPVWASPAALATRRG